MATEKIYNRISILLKKSARLHPIQKRGCTYRSCFLACILLNLPKFWACILVAHKLGHFICKHPGMITDGVDSGPDLPTRQKEILIFTELQRKTMNSKTSNSISDLPRKFYCGLTV